MTENFIIENGVLETYNPNNAADHNPKEASLNLSIVEIPKGVRVIGANAFKGCIHIEQVILPETVTEIMAHAFKGCRNLKQINFPSKLNTIGEYAFHRCHSLLAVNLPQSVKYLGNCAFLYCDGLEQVSIPGVIQLGKQVFLNDINIKTLEISQDLESSCVCDVFTSCSKISTISFSGGNSYQFETPIDVLSSNSKYPLLIKTIATDIFRMMEINDGEIEKFLTNIKHVELPNGIKSIKKSCFFDKKGIITIKLPKTLTKIGSKAFRNCINLEKVEFSNENVEISPDAFKNCTTLKYIQLPDGKEYELNGLADETNENIPSIVRNIHTQILGNFFICGTTLVKYRGKEERVVVPEGIKTIGERAFAGNEIVGRVILPDSIQEIRQEAFADCLLLQTVHFPLGLTSIRRSAFENCVKLIRALLPDSVIHIEKSVFNRCKKLSEITLGNSLEKIPELAFYACVSLKMIQFPENLKVIEHMAFYKCLSLREVHLPSSFTKLGNNVFTNSGIRTATIKAELKECGTGVFSRCRKLHTLSFYDGIQTIGDKFAFQCPALHTVNIPDTIESIGVNAFEGSIFFDTFNDSSINGKIFLNGSKCYGHVSIPEGITVIAGGAFYGNENIVSISLPKTLEKIGARSFCGCTSLKEISLPEKISVLEEGVFAYCTSLEKVDGNLKKISADSFYKCSELLHLSLSEVDEIGKNAFLDCHKLDELTIHDAHIQEDAFKGTLFLKNLLLSAPVAIIANTVLDGKCCVTECIIPEGITHISPFAFSNNDKLARITFPRSLKSIGEGAFYGCKNLEEIQIQSEGLCIGKNAFKKCINLRKVSGSVSHIKEGAFSFCIGLKEASFSGVTSYEKEAFCGCSSLETCICNEVEIIEENCFSDCISLKEFDFTNIILIGDGSFSQCNALRSISLNTKTMLGSYAFKDCGRLEEISISNREQLYGSYAFCGCTALKTISINTKHYYLEGYTDLLRPTLPDIVKNIYNSAMSCFEIDENLSLSGYSGQGHIVHIPNHIKRIEWEVFKDMVTIEEIHIPESISYIGSRAFHGTSWLEQQRSTTSLVIRNNILIDAATSKGHVIIPEHIKVISGWAFANCFGLTELTLTSPYCKVEEYAFRNCIHLKKVNTANNDPYELTCISDKDGDLPPTIQQIFSDCYHCFKTDDNQTLVESTGNISDLVLANGIHAIGNLVYQNSNLLTRITFSKDIKTIGERAFEQCKWLKQVKNAHSVTCIHKFAFSGCTSLEEIELSEHLQSFGIGSFEHCTSLKSILIPEGITEIPEKAFFRCKSLTSVSLPSTLEVIGKEAFAFCSELAEVHVPKNHINVDTCAFSWCTKLKLPIGSAYEI